MTYYPEPDSHIRDKVKEALLDLSNYATKVCNKVFKNTKFNTLKTKVNNFENKIPDITTLI